MPDPAGRTRAARHLARERAPPARRTRRAAPAYFTPRTSSGNTTWLVPFRNRVPSLRTATRTNPDSPTASPGTTVLPSIMASPPPGDPGPDRMTAVSLCFARNGTAGSGGGGGGAGGGAGRATTTGTGGFHRFDA